jgi:protein subunit release factor A
VAEFLLFHHIDIGVAGSGASGALVNKTESAVMFATAGV